MLRRWLLGVGFVCLTVACGSADDPASPTTAGATGDDSIDDSADDSIDDSGEVTADVPVDVSTTAAAPATTGVPPAGFPTTRAVVTDADGTTCEVCLWLADNVEDRARGLMFVTDLGVADGMAFRYPEPRTGTFWMENVALPLSIAFFAADGAYLDAFDMEPCRIDPCPHYGTPTDFLVAVEVEQGRLGELGLVEGSTLELLDLPCDAR